MKQEFILSYINKNEYSCGLVVKLVGYGERAAAVIAGLKDDCRKYERCEYEIKESTLEKCNIILAIISDNTADPIYELEAAKKNGTAVVSGFICERGDCELLKSCSDIIIPLGEDIEKAESVLTAYCDMLCDYGLIGVDFRDICAVTNNVGVAYAAEIDIDPVTVTDKLPQIKNARKCLLCVYIDTKDKLEKVVALMHNVTEKAHPDATLIVGAYIRENIPDSPRAVLIAGSFG